jgi:8-oxo-dGTP pyrophosphatase MutT (NUDIX family)
MNDSSFKYIEFIPAVEKIKQVLSDFKPVRIDLENARNSAVMILFINKDNLPYIIFTKRTDWVETHKGQISFPGGARDLADETLLRTATRETLEEIGIPPDDIEVVGRLDDFYTITNFTVSPFVGYIPNGFQYSINEREVARILEVPLSVFLDDQYFEVKKWDHKGRFYDVYFYHFENEVIWGATAFIINRFIDTVFKYNPAPHPILGDPRNEHYLRQNREKKSKP